MGQIIKKRISYTGGGDPIHVYSTNEQIVGRWIDGSTIYEKTIIVDSGFSAQMTVNHGISSIDEIINTSGMVKTTDPAWFPINDNIPVSGYQISATNYNRTSFDVYIQSSRLSSVAEIRITIQYTKT